jgi:hypothetical protein
MQTMKARTAVLLAAGAVGLGCGADGARRVCDQCVAGGETTDFGGTTDGCEIGETVSPVSLDEARALGFEDPHVRLEQSFSQPFEWTPIADGLNGGEPARGYDRSTTVDIRTRVTSFEHRARPAEGCEDVLGVNLAVGFRTQDGALEVESSGYAWAERDQAMTYAVAKFDLSHAFGTLELRPKSWEPPLVGGMGMALGFWPNDVRGSVGLALHTPGMANSNVYHPLDGRFPIDACDFYQRPFAATTPDALPTGASAAEWRDELQAILEANELVGGWNAPDETTVNVELGPPLDVCQQGAAISYRLGLDIESADGVIQVAGDARAYTGFDASGTLERSWIELYDGDAILARDFEQATGISGIVWGDIPAAIWHVNLHFAEGGVEELHGAVVVEGVDIDGRLTGVTGAITGIIASFDFSPR